MDFEGFFFSLRQQAPESVPSEKDEIPERSHLSDHRMKNSPLSQICA